MTAAAEPGPAAREPQAFDVQVAAYPAAWRASAAVLRTVARGSLLATLAAVLFSDNPPTNPLKQMRIFFSLFVLPEAAAWYIARTFAARVRVTDEALVIEQRDGRTEIPVSAIAAIEPWRVPVPRAGVSLRLRSGRRFSLGLAVADPAALVEALVAEGGAPELRSALDRPIAVWRSGRLAWPAGWLEHPLLKFVIFGLVPTLPAWRLHQFIAYGGTFGEYYTFGLKAYLLGFGLWWFSFSFSLLVIAAGIRAAVEILAFAAAVAVPGHAAVVRRGLEILQRILFYIGIPLWIALRFTA